MVLRANTGGKSLDRGSASGDMSQSRGLESAPEPGFGLLRAGEAQRGGEFHVTGEAMGCSTRARQAEP